MILHPVQPSELQTPECLLISLIRIQPSPNTATPPVYRKRKSLEIIPLGIIVMKAALSKSLSIFIEYKALDIINLNLINNPPYLSKFRHPVLCARPLTTHLWTYTHLRVIYKNI